MNNQAKRVFETRIVSKEIVKPIKLDRHVEDKDAKGGDVFSLYSNIFLCAKKKSGKTSTVYKILKMCCNSKTNIIIFASTVNKDENWKKIVQRFSKTNNVATYTSLFEDGIDRLKEFIDMLQEEVEESSTEESKSEDEPDPICEFDDPPKRRSKKKKRAKQRAAKPKRKIAPEYVFVLDDLSTELSKPIISAFVKKNRHFKCKVIISSQWWNDLHSQARQQLDYILLYPKMRKDKLEVIHKEADLAIPLKEFNELYEDATSKQYNFLYVDVRNEKFRRNFTDEYIL